MTRRATLASVVAGLAFAGPAPAHEGSPYFESTVTSVTPTEGLRVDILNRDDRVELTNETGQTVLVLGYEGEPYARLRADGTVEVNRLSAATYLNEDRYAGVKTPEFVDADAPPQWKRISGTGRFEWHDHRIHWMSKKVPPPQVKDPERRTKVFDWSLPLRVGEREGTIAGQLFWTPSDDGGGPPTAAIVVLAAILLGSSVAVVVVRRRRRRSSAQREVW